MSWSGELHGRYGQALAGNAVLIILAAGAAIAYVVATDRKREWKLPPWAPTVALSALCVFALVWAWQLRWLSDDAFISFRYAQNWVDGNGLVFNPGERVEGYTNFLWVVLLAIPNLVGIDIPTTAVLLCLGSQVGVLIMTTRLVRRLAPESKPVIVSLAAIVLACSYLTATYATGGLETTFGAFLVLLSIEKARDDKLLVSGLCGIAATMAHPDHAIFYVALGGVLLVRRVPIKKLIWYAAPFLVVFVPYFLIRWNYYGLFFPNTYYTKSGGATYFSQGGFYLYASALSAGLLGVLPLAVYGAIRRRRELVVQFAMVAAPLYLIYVAKVGGDFMLGRLLIPALPLVLILGELGVRTLIEDKRWKIAVPALLIASLACIPTRVIKHQEYIWHLTDERTFYQFDGLWPLEMKGNIPRRVATLKRYFTGSNPPPKYAAFAIGMLGYETGWPVVDIHGLIDVELSAMPLAKRGRPGHERYASPAHIVKRGADISAMGVYDGRYDREITKLTLDKEGYALTRYRADLLDPLRDDPTVKFTRFPEYIDTFLAKAPQRGQAELKRELDFLDRFYFAGNPDPVRRDKLLELIALAK
ncbi:MAG: hypothetical protein H0V17_35920 [Deltaproteobacteria bacterium]|nr:hypothetical protein [Deltaproteobacteria bacterium]